MLLKKQKSIPVKKKIKIKALINSGPKATKAFKKPIRKSSNKMNDDVIVSHDYQENWWPEAGP